MARFEDAIATVIANEGGWADHPRDPGGRTRFGISSRYHPEVDLDSLTLEGAQAIYRRDYWDRHGIGVIDSQEVATKLLDASVLLGPRPAIRLLQQALRAAGRPVTVDGIIGPETTDATNNAPTDALLAAFRSEMAGYLRERVARNPVKGVFLRGWENRAYS